MLTKPLQEFKIKYGIRSAQEWADATGVSKSTIQRTLNGTGKGMGVDTLELLVRPYGGSIDELLGLGAYSPEALEKDELKNEMRDKIESVIEVIENSEEIPPAPTEEIKSALEEVHEYITNEAPTEHGCNACSTYREIITELKADKVIKDKWLIRLFGLAFIMLGIVLALIIAVAILSACIVNIM